MINPVSGSAMVALLAIGTVLVLPLAGASAGAAMLFAAIWFSGGAIAALCVKLTAPWERALVFRRGKYLGTRGPGAFLVIPLVDTFRIVDNRIPVIRDSR